MVRRDGPELRGSGESSSDGASACESDALQLLAEFGNTSTSCTSSAIPAATAGLGGAEQMGPDTSVGKLLGVQQRSC